MIHADVERYANEIAKLVHQQVRRLEIYIGQTNLTMSQAAVLALHGRQDWMTEEELWAEISSRGLYKSEARTPARTLRNQLRHDMKMARLTGKTFRMPTRFSECWTRARFTL